MALSSYDTQKNYYENYTAHQRFKIIVQLIRSVALLYNFFCITRKKGRKKERKCTPIYRTSDGFPENPSFPFLKKGRKNILNSLLKENHKHRVRFSFKRNIAANFHASELKLKIFLQLVNQLLPEKQRDTKRYTLVRSRFDLYLTEK